MAFYSRGKNKIQDKYSLVDMYEDYIADINVDSPYFVSKKEYIKINEEFYSAIMNKIIKEGVTFKNFAGLGLMYIFKVKVNIFKKKSIPIDWALTQQYKKIIQNLNEHTRGYKYGFFWSKDRFAFNNKSLYKFIATRANKRLLAKTIKSGNMDYLIKDK